MQFDINGPAASSAATSLRSAAIQYERWLIGGVLLIGVVIGLWLISAPSAFPRTALVTIPNGANGQEFASILSQRHLIRSAFVFRAVTHLTGLDHRLDTGAYLFSKPVSLPVIVWRLWHGQHGIAPVRVTLTEGMTRYDIANTLQGALAGFDADAFLTESSSSEGYLFPETYFFMPNDTPSSIVTRLTAQFASSTASVTPEVAKSGHTFRDTVIMASLLEREAKTPEDMRIVAGILWNRITHGMPLQVDATFGYIHQQNGYTPTAADLASDSPYNTYTHTGLPPTPISNPGIESLTAAAMPAKTQYVYYLTGKDGKMHYARTYVEHQKNIELYLK